MGVCLRVFVFIDASVLSCVLPIAQKCNLSTNEPTTKETHKHKEHATNLQIDNTWLRGTLSNLKCLKKFVLSTFFVTFSHLRDAAFVMRQKTIASSRCWEIEGKGSVTE